MERMMDKSGFTKEQIDAMPTILDVVERISAIENSQIMPFVSKIPVPADFDEGRYCYVSEEHNRMVVHLMPMSQSPFTFYRGQSRYYEPCKPSLYRRKSDGSMPTETDIVMNRIRVCELELLLYSHPVFREVSHNTYVDSAAMAQHYGLNTEYLDITNSKWVAAFFASTRYDYATDTYYPVGRDYGEGYGVMYIFNLFEKKGHADDFLDKNAVIGYQYFDRPTRQSSFGYKMQAGEDFNESPFFNRVFFRHDLEASKIVFDMSYNQRRFIPNDSLSRMVRQIAESREVSRWALERCLQMYYPDKNNAYLESVCFAKGLTIRDDGRPIVAFSQDELAEDWKVWNEFGREDLKSRILPLRAVASFKFQD